MFRNMFLFVSLLKLIYETIVHKGPREKSVNQYFLNYVLKGAWRGGFPTTLKY